MLTLICIGNHEHRHPDGSPGGQARIFHLVKPHHGSFGRELSKRQSHSDRIRILRLIIWSLAFTLYF